ncbi:replication-relaxation family protein [Crossiella sp. SN42]|uniref:replication-relaxation family protein n=1 Tax=Crossiella sp. SN42 TaxID=2944808 RepID=UPI00207D0142|nr:replication-relaxation family protein [Crossiella sp. SN42]MCO1577102.1 replication-relaxation family protein [Crossiella sp. SN42]
MPTPASPAVRGQITDRDRRVLALLAEHFTFTTSQLALLAGFGSVITAQHRLAMLHKRDVLHRDRPFRSGGGSYEWHWMLGPVGARLIAEQHRVAPIRPAKVSARWRKLFHGWRWAELSAQHAWFCTLVADGTAGDLVVWRSAWRVSRTWQATTDGYGRWRYPDGRELAFALLLDDPPRVGAHELCARLAKLPDPDMPFTRRTGPSGDTIPLLWCATPHREETIRRAVAKFLGGETGMPLGLACAQQADTTAGGAHGRVWLPLGSLRHLPGRLTLAELAEAARSHANPNSTYWTENDDELIRYDDTEDWVA